MSSSYVDNFVKTTIFNVTEDCGNIISRNSGQGTFHSTKAKCSEKSLAYSF